MLYKIILPIPLFCCLALLSACGPQFIPPHTPPLADPELKDSSFITFDGTRLPLRTWLPGGGMDTARCLFIAVHGFNDYSNFINGAAEFFVTRNIAVYAYDQRGFGNAPDRGRWSSTAAMTRDLDTLVRLITQEHPALPVYLLGHSMGAAVVIAAMAGQNHHAVAGAILAAPAVWARSTMPSYQSVGLWLIAHTLPWFRATGEFLQIKASDNIEMLRELGRDPLVIKETRFDTIYGLQNLMDTAYEAATRFRLKALVLYGEHDEIIPRKPVQDVFQNFPAQSARQKTFILYENGYHMLLRDLQGKNVMRDIVAWVNDQQSEAGTR